MKNEIIYSTVYEGTYDYIQCCSDSFNINSSSSEIRLDLSVKEKYIYMIWGQVKTQDGTPIKGAIIYLLKSVSTKNKFEYTCINTTNSDYLGMYYFEVNKDDLNHKCRVIAIV